jgi:hypothetical protein
VLLVSPAYAEDELKQIKPLPGRAVIQPSKPDWCAGYKHEPNHCDEHCQERTLDSFVRHLGKEVEESDLPRVAAMACDFPDSSRVQQQIAYLRQDWINRAGLTDAEDRTALKLYVTHTESGAHGAAVDQACASLEPTAPWGTVDRARQLAIKNALCNGDPLKRERLPADVSLADMTWMERTDKPTSQIALAYYLLHSLPQYRPERDDFSRVRQQAVAAQPLAALLAARLDAKTFAAEVEALKLQGIARIRAQIVFGAARSMHQTWADATRDELKGSAGLSKAVPAAAEAFAAWPKLYEQHKAAFDLALAVEDKVLAIQADQRSKPHAIGCEELRQALIQHIEAQKPKTPGDVREAATDTLGYPLLARLVLCDAAEGRWADAAAERKVLETGRFAAGPWTAAYWAMIDAAPHELEGLTLVDAATTTARDILGERVRASSTLNEVYDGTGGVSREEFKRQGNMIEQGRVAGVKTTKDGIVVTFKKERWSEPDFDCKNTGRISQWDSSGKPVYIYHCNVSGSHVEEFQLEPHLFTDRSAAGVKIGQVIKVVTSTMDKSGGDAQPSFVLEIDQPPKGKSPPAIVSYFGVRLGK